MRYNDIRTCAAAMALALFASIGLSSCEDSHVAEAPGPAVSIVSSDVLFGPRGGTGSIGFESEGVVTAYSEQPWCSVSVEGKTVSVTAGEYADLENRYASIILKADGDSVRVVAQQNGIVLTSDAEDEYVAGDAQSEINFTIKSNSDVRMQSSASWIRCSMAGENITVTLKENNSGHIRNGWFSYASGNVADTVYVSQADVKDLYGNYKLMGYSNSGSLVYLPATISEAEGENDVTVTCSASGQTWKFNGTFDPVTHRILFANGQYTGEWNVSGYTFYIYICMLSSRTNSFSWNPEYACEAVPQYDAEHEQTLIKLQPVSYANNTSTIDYDSWVFAAFQSMDAETGLPKGNASAYPAILYTPFFQSL